MSKKNETSKTKAQCAIQSVRLSLPTTKEIREAREAYDKRAYAGHFAGDEPWKHFHAGIEWMLARIDSNEA